jgi:ParB/RepB/Spo0J family partition protein
VKLLLSQELTDMVLPSANSDDEIREILIADVLVDPQVRKEFDPSSLQELAASLKESGQQQPILVRRLGDTFKLIFGERRLRAAQLAGWTKIRAIVTQVDLTESEIVQRQLIENMQRIDLCPLEVAKGMRQLMDLNGLKAGVVATRLGVSAATVTKHLGLLKLPESLQEQVASGAIAMSAAYELSRVDDAGVRSELAGELATGRLTRDGLAGAIKARSKVDKKDTSGLATRVTALLSGGRTVTVLGPSLNLEGFIEALEELLNKARKVRPQGVELGTFAKMLRDQAMQLP